jgi:cell pole-organizing protein PopZ
MNDAKAQQEPTMEEILASIRRIISEDDKPAEGEAAAAEESDAAADDVDADPDSEEVLELTEVVEAEGTVDVDEAPEPVAEEELADFDELPEPEPEPAFPDEPEPAPAPSLAAAAAARFAGRGGLVSDPTAISASSSFANLAGAVTATRGMPMGQGSKTLEDLVKELLRPMLKEWLDRHLPPLVERLVEREIAKLAASADEK